MITVQCCICNEGEEVKAKSQLQALNKLGDKGWKLKGKGMIMCLSCKEKEPCSD